MAKNYLIVVDMQNDFVSGSLGTEEAQRIVAAVIDKVKNFEGDIVFTMDTHSENYLDTQEGKLLPVKHCIKGTVGHNLIEELDKIAQAKNCKIYEKHAFGSIELAESLKKKNENEKIQSIELIGLCTDICVISNALLIKAYLPEVTVKTDEALCAGVTPEKHKAALEVMRSCQIIVNGI